VLKHEPKDNAYQLTIGGEPYNTRKTKVHQSVYRISAHEHTISKLPLVDRGSNGMVFGSDVTVFYTHPHQKVCIEGIDSHRINDVLLAHAAGVVTSSIGDIVIILPWGEKHVSGATIMCPAQMEYFGHKVDKQSRIVNGNQCITTTNGVVIPINIVNGLPRLPIRPCTDHSLFCFHAS
jgi:hypothetical protein